MFFREKQQLLICVLAAVMVVGFVLLRYLPLHRKMETLEHARADHQAAITKTCIQSGHLPSLKDQLAQLQQEVGNYEARVPTQRDLGAFLKSLTNLMDEQKLTEQLIKPGAESQAETLSCMPVNMQCKGSLIRIYEFFDALQSLDRLVRIKKVELTNDKDFSGVVSMKAETVIYYRKDTERQARQG